jgi:hypothetical protein
MLNAPERNRLAPVHAAGSAPATGNWRKKIIIAKAPTMFDYKPQPIAVVIHVALVPTVGIAFRILFAPTNLSVELPINPAGEYLCIQQVLKRMINAKVVCLRQCHVVWILYHLL